MKYRATPLDPTLNSPAEILFGRKIQSNLPVYVRGPTNDIAREKQAQKSNKSAEQHSTSAKELVDLQISQHVFYYDIAKRIGSPGVILGYGPEPRSYTVYCNMSGRYLRRIRVMLRPRVVTFSNEHLNKCGRNEMVTNAHMHHHDMSTQDRKQPTPAVANATQQQPAPRRETVQAKNQDVLKTRSGRSVRPPSRLINELKICAKTSNCIISHTR